MTDCTLSASHCIVYQSSGKHSRSASVQVLIPLSTYWIKPVIFFFFQYRCLSAYPLPLQPLRASPLKTNTNNTKSFCVGCWIVDETLGLISPNYIPFLDSVYHILKNIDVGTSKNKQKDNNSIGKKFDSETFIYMYTHSFSIAEVRANGPDKT